MQLRRSLLYVPGDREAMLAKAASRGADALILNLEDAVAPAHKQMARELVAACLAKQDFGASEVIVRINPLESADGFTDLLTISPWLLGPPGARLRERAAILLPKVSSAAEVRLAAWTLDRLEQVHSLPPRCISLMCMIESAAGVLDVRAIALSSPRVAALVFGAADFSAETGCPSELDAPLLLHARCSAVLAGRAAGIDVIDAPHMLLNDPGGLACAASDAVRLGFAGKSAIHPAQLPAIHAAFAPDEASVAWAQRVCAALQGLDEAGAAVLDGQLIEAPHLARAQAILARAGAIR